MGETAKERNRREMPEFTKGYDSLTAAFGQCKVLYAREGDIEVGVDDSDEYVSVFVERTFDDVDDRGRPRKRNGS
tara:strand:- start:3120 stop:3344 length:225 start_codon:yes stop_codon:yes gene_type:complete